jgi:circadian clock protein KaiC
VTSTPQPLTRLSTGNTEFDRILGGGLPERSLSMIAGPAGSGKTLFALQMLFHLARQGKRGLYLTTLSEPALKLIGYMQQFAFFDARLVDDLITFADLGSVLRAKGPEAAHAEIANRIERDAPALVVVDSFKALRDSVAQASALRAFAYDLAVHSASWGVTSLLVGEYGDTEMSQDSEFAIADGIIRFGHLRHELTAIREVEILKLRGAAYVTGRHFFEINAAGLDFFARVSGPDDRVAEPDRSAERVPTGVAGLDEMLDGGLPRASAVVVQGGTGTGKTLLGLRFLVEGAQRGEPGIHFSMEETTEQLRGIARGLGWDLRSLEQRGLLTLRYVSPIELSTDRFLHRARQDLERVGARRAVLDSLTSLGLSVSAGRRFNELVYAIAKHARALGVTLVMNQEIADLLGSAQLSGHGVSFAADSVILLKYVEREGRLERGIAVLKARGVRHATDVRTLTVGATGLDVGPAYHGLRGVLTGLPLPLRGEDRER